MTDTYYEKYVKEKRAKDATKPQVNTTIRRVIMDEDTILAMIDLINQNKTRYGANSQLLMNRAARQLQQGLL